MDLAMIQIYPRLEAVTSPGVPNLEELNNMLMQLCDYAVASNHQLKGEISELGCEIIGRMKVEKVAISSRNQTIHLSQDEISSLPTNLDSIWEAIRITEEAVMENQKRLLEHVAELKKMQTLGQQVSERIENLEKSSWQSQKMFQAVAERQDKSDGQLNAVKQIILDWSEPKLPMVQTTEQHQSMEVNALASGIGAYHTDTANLMEFVKRCPQNKDPIQNELPTTNPYAQRSPILVENNGFLIVEEGGV
ncbi:hypothetical protein Pst134EB_029970 [Puccinia striiformis f. sp. tritici]|nr:hypothetical protein Pst134EB_029970 [Puccinia striiformis f. sp. tritici]